MRRVGANKPEDIVTNVAGHIAGEASPIMILELRSTQRIVGVSQVLMVLSNDAYLAGAVLGRR